jgi:hypothetical protein
MTAQVLVNGSPDVFGDRQTGSGRQSFKRLDNSLWQKNMCAFHTHMIAFLRRQNIGEKNEDSAFIDSFIVRLRNKPDW